MRRPPINILPLKARALRRGVVIRPRRGRDRLHTIYGTSFSEKLSAEKFDMSSSRSGLRSRSKLIEPAQGPSEHAGNFAVFTDALPLSIAIFSELYGVFQRQSSSCLSRTSA